MSKEFVISDDDSTVIQKEDLQKKVNKINVYLKKIEARTQQLDQKLTLLHGAKPDKNLQKGLEYYHLDDNVSKEV